jgi:hypothetical protein
MDSKTIAIAAVKEYITATIPTLPAGQNREVKLLIDKAESMPSEWYETTEGVGQFVISRYVGFDQVKLGQAIAKRLLAAMLPTA